MKPSDIRIGSLIESNTMKFKRRIVDIERHKGIYYVYVEDPTSNPRQLDMLPLSSISAYWKVIKY